MVRPLFNLLLLAFCSLQFLPLPAREFLSPDTNSPVNFVAEESEEVECLEKFCDFACNLPSLDCQHDEVVGEASVLVQYSCSADGLSRLYSRGPPMN